MTDVCFCFCRWRKSGWFLWSLGPTRNPFFPETSWMWTHLTQHTFSLLFWLSEMSSCPSLHRTDVYLSPRVEQIFKLLFLMQQQTVVNDSGFLKYSWAHVAIFNTAAWRFLMQCHLRGQRSSTFNWGVLPCPTCTAISLHSLNLFTILCMGLSERPTFFAILHCEMSFFDASLMKFGTKWWAMIQLCLRYCSMLQPSKTAFVQKILVIRFETPWFEHDWWRIK